MRHLLAVVLVVLTFSTFMLAQQQPELSARVKSAVALLYAQDSSGSMQMTCTATVFDKKGDHYRLASAAHCVGADDTSRERSADASNIPFYVTFDEVNDVKKFYPAKALWVGYQHRGEDFSEFEVDTKEAWTVIPLGDEKKEKDGGRILNIASPLGLGKQVFHGTISSLFLDRPIIQDDINWKGSMLLAINAGPGSSGSALVSETQEAIVGFLVGTIGGNNVVGIPVSRFKAVRKAVGNKTYKWYQDKIELAPDGTPQ